MRKITTSFLFCVLFCSFYTNVSAQYQMEKLNRGVLAVRNGNNNFISWRWLGNEADGITFNLYRNGAKVNSNSLTVCNYLDNGAPSNATYYVKAIVNGVEQNASETASTWGAQYLRIPIQNPPGGTSPDNVAYTYVANDASVADLDGDGTYEIILKWDPTNSKDNSQSGYTGNTYVDAYKMDGTFMWRVDFGRNVRSGAHYMDFMVYDFNGDGKAEMMARTADGTKDGKGKIIGSSTADYRTSNGYVLTGPEFISVFNGETGSVMATQDYWPARGVVGDWGDTYGNRVDRFKAAVAYLDGVKASGIFCRGYYTRMTVAAWDWNGTNLSRRWTFDSGFNSSNPYYSQGAHSLSVADVDGDGKQEVITGAAIIDDNGSGYYSTQKGHGDALHVGDFDPSIAGLEVFHIQEPVGDAGVYMYSGKSKSILWKKPSLAGSSEGPGRGVCADISAQWPGAESWVLGGGISSELMDVKGNFVAAGPTSGGSGATCNFVVWWDGDPLRELLTDTRIDKYGGGRLLTAYNSAPVSSNNGSKATPCLSGDILGDWREEIIWRASDNSALYLFTTVSTSNLKFRTLMHDPQYRVAIAWQNTGYNQPPHPSFFLGDGVSTLPKPNIVIVGSVKDCNGVENGNAYQDSCGFCVGGNTGKLPCTKDCNGAVNGKATIDNCGRCVAGNTGLLACTNIAELENLPSSCTFVGVKESSNSGFLGVGYLNLDNTVDSDLVFELNATQSKQYNLLIRYANGSANDRPMKLSVNGIVQIANLSFPSTGSWTAWSFVSIDLNLTNQGSNMVLLSSLTAEGAANLDLIGNTTGGLTIGDCIVSALDDFTDFQVSLYPNPSESEFTLETINKSEISVYNLTGELVYQSECTGKCAFGKEFEKGIYYISVRGKETIRNFKVVKQ